MTARELQHGIRENQAQYVHRLIQVLLVVNPSASSQNSVA